MGLFRRAKQAAPSVGSVARGECSCHEHVDALRAQPLPLGAGAAGSGDEPTVGELLEVGALGVEPAEDVWSDTDGGRLGPFHWELWLGDEVRAAYDDDAPLGVDEALRRRPGVALVEWQDREVFRVSAPTLCAEGVLAAAVRALLDPDVRLPG